MSAHTITPLPPWGTLHSHCLVQLKLDSSAKNTLLLHVSGHRRWAFAYWSWLQRRTAVRSRPWWGWRACRWASLRVCAKIWAVVQTHSFISCPGGWSRRWRSRMGSSVAGVVTRCLRLWGQLDVLPISLKWCWRWLMDEKGTFNYLETALVDIPAVSMPIAQFLKTWDICGIVTCVKTAHFRVAFYCPQHKVHLSNDHAV